MELTKVQKKIIKESGKAFVITVAASCFFAALAAVWLVYLISTALSSLSVHKTSEFYFVTSVSGLLNTLFAGTMSCIAAKFFYEIKKNTAPFTEKSTRLLKTIALSALLMACVLFVIDLVRMFTTDNFYWLSSSALLYLLMSFIFGFFARVFDYGKQLQKESDETL